MISEAIRRRLQRLNRIARRSPFPPVKPEKQSPEDGAILSSAKNLTRLEEAVDGQEVATPTGKFLLIDRSASQLIRSAGEFVARYSCAFERGAATFSEESHPIDLVRFVECRPRKSVFLDIETTGLCRTPLFLVGLLLYRGDDLLLRQLFARDYSEEKPLLEYLLDLLAEFEVLVTFNGKAFDLPYIRDRCSFNLLPFRLEFHHLDLLHEYRRRWRRILPDCRLLTLESRICARYRTGDIPGGDIPTAYHDFVRTGDARQIKEILHHNALDLLTMSELTLKLCPSEG